MSVFFYGCITLDGYLADKNHNLDWLYQTGDVGETDYESFYNSMDVIIMGKKTFNELEKMDNIDSIYPTTENYVITHAESLSARGFVPVNCDIVEFVKQIEKDKNIWIVGGSTIMAPLLDSDMVDNMIIQIAPVLLGTGIPLFTQKEVLKRFYLKEVKQYGQFAELIYSKLQTTI
ncbi:diacylglycerol kinase [Lacrimispora amygdalina]|uniref:Diacylglycerol kinase n=1 Tax=Lacrimispora amygdalina TaxID=253257 RepID=A0ABQ5M9K3_9FIRM